VLTYTPYRNMLPVTPDAMAWRNAVLAASGTVSPQQLARVSTLIRALKAGDVWSSLDRLWLFAAENATQALIDLKARATATVANAPTFTANRGYAGNGSNAIVNTGFNPTSGSPNYTQSSAHWGLWVETTSSGATMRLGGQDSANTTDMSSNGAGATTYTFGVNQAAGVNTTVANTSLGDFDFVRTGAAAIVSYHLGAQTATATNASIAIPNNNFFVLAGNNAGVAFVPTDGRVAGFWAGGALTAPQVAAFRAARRAYMTAVGVA
jgi:hypothetical protein